DLTSPAGARLARWQATGRGRAVVRALSGTRLDPAAGPTEPVAAVIGGIAPGFVVIAHDPDELVFGAAHAEALYAAAGEPKELCWQPGAGLGRSVLTPAFVERVRAEIMTRAATAPASLAPSPPPPPVRPAGR